jgi:DNA invertase Pin-like site-specific DNA recombinase
MLVGYVRVSTSDQSIQRQVDELVKYGVALVDIYADTASGKNLDRPGWELCWKQLEPGDVLVVHSLDRLGRNLLEVIQLEKQIQAKGCTLKVLAQDINTSTPTGRLIFHILMTVAQFEREWNLERTMHGLQKARERGVKGGALPKFNDEEIAAAMEKNSYNLRLAAKAVGCSKVTMMRRWQSIQEQRLMREEV